MIIFHTLYPELSGNKAPKNTYCIYSVCRTYSHACNRRRWYVSNYDAGACDETAICSTELLYSGEAEWY